MSLEVFVQKEVIVQGGRRCERPVQQENTTMKLVQSKLMTVSFVRQGNNNSLFLVWYSLYVCVLYEPDITKGFSAWKGALLFILSLVSSA